MLFALLALFAPAVEPNKKVIVWGWDSPNTAYLRKHIRDMERLPFDGVAIRVTKSREPIAEPRDGLTQQTLGWLAFGGSRFQPEDYQHAVDDLKATKFKKFRHNFMQLMSMPGLDWFDSRWDDVLFNTAVIARIAKEGGCVGLLFDPEEYGKNRMWTFSEAGGARDRKVILEKVKERGSDFMRAIEQEFPGVKVLCSLGPSFSIGREDYDLLPAFIEGMCRVAGPGSQIIDGAEQSYGFERTAQFQMELHKMKIDSRQLFAEKTLYDQKMRVGFGLWIDYLSGGYYKGWHPSEPAKNHFTPEEWRATVRTALRHSDEYVWIYSQKLNWWTGEGVTKDYLAAFPRS